MQPVTPSAPNSLNTHDYKVILFQVVTAMLVGAVLAGLQVLAKTNFGVYTPFLAPMILAAAEAVRRYMV